MSFFPLPPSPSRQLLNFPPQAKRQSPKHSWRVTWQILSPPALWDPAGTMLLPMPSQNVSTFLTLVRAIGKATVAHPKGSSGKGFGVQTAVHRWVGVDPTEAQGAHPAKRSCSCCVSSSVGGSGAAGWIWISSSCSLCCCSRPRCWPGNRSGRASSPRSSRWPWRRISGGS